MLLYSLIEELCTKEENGKTGRNLNFGHECTLLLHIFRAPRDDLDRPQFCKK